MRAGEGRAGRELLWRAGVAARQAVERGRGRVDEVSGRRNRDRTDLERGIDGGDSHRRVPRVDPLHPVLVGHEDAARYCARDAPGLAKRRDLVDLPRRRDDTDEAGAAELDHEQRAVRLDGMPVGWSSTSGGGASTRIEPRLERVPPARAMSRHLPAFGKRSCAR